MNRIYAYPFVIALTCSWGFMPVEAAVPAISTESVVAIPASSSTEVQPEEEPLMPTLMPLPTPPPSPKPIATQTPVPPGVPEINPNAMLKPITLELKEMDIVEVLKMLCKPRGINLIVDKNVSGRVTLLLNNVEFWEAFKAILNSRDLAYVKVGDLVEVMASPDYEKIYGAPFDKRTQTLVIPLKHAKATLAKTMLEPIKSKAGSVTVDEITNSLIIDDIPTLVAHMQELVSHFDVPQEMRIFRLSNAMADELQAKITPLISKDAGSLQVDKRSNSLIVQDNPARMEEIANLIHAFDIRDKAVLIEAKVMQVIFNKNVQAGVNWSSLLNKINGTNLTGSLTQNLQLVPLASVTPPVSASGLTAVGNIPGDLNLNFIVNLLNTIGKTNLLSSPRVAALNHETAKIEVISKVAKITKSVLNAGSTTTQPITTTNVDFLDVGVKLAVTPTIGDDNMITLKVKPEVSSVENTITTDDGSIIPVIRLSQAEASLMVKDGVTVVLGGLMEDSLQDTDSYVPFLGRIPLIGFLFRSRNKTTVKTELVVFLTPHIINGDAVSPEVQQKLAIDAAGKPAKKKGFWRRLFGRRDDAPDSPSQ